MFIAHIRENRPSSAEPPADCCERRRGKSTSHGREPRGIDGQRVCEPETRNHGGPARAERGNGPRESRPLEILDGP